MADLMHNWFLYLVIAANVAFMLVLLFVTVSEAFGSASGRDQS
jgi:hypothetical protein